MSSGVVVKTELNSSYESQGSLYSDYSKKRRYRGKKKPCANGRAFTKLEDPNAPRKPRSGARRNRYGTVRQGYDQKSVNVSLAAEWQSLSNEQRQPYLDLASKEREQYKIELKAYEQTEQYKQFMEKKEKIMRFRKQCRRLGFEGCDEMDDLEASVLGIAKKTKSELERAAAEAIMLPMLPDSDVPIFSKEFLEYNKSREAYLRSIRREIGNAEAEKEAMQKTITNMQAKNKALESEIAHDKKACKEADHIIDSWMRVLKGAMGETMKEHHLNTPEETIAFLTKLADGDASNEDVLHAVKEVIHSASFSLSK